MQTSIYQVQTKVHFILVIDGMFDAIQQYTIQ